MKSYVLSHGRNMGERIFCGTISLNSFCQIQSCFLACTQFFLEPGSSPAQNLAYDLHAGMHGTTVVTEHLVNLV